MRDLSEPVSIEYPSVIEPGVGLFLQRVNQGSNLETIAADIQHVGSQAWENSDWLQELAQNTQISAGSLARQAFDPESAEKITAQVDRLSKIGRGVIYWTAKTYGSENSSDVVGFAKAELEVNGNFVVKGIKRALGKTYVCLHDVNVLPEVQGNGIGSALAYQALGHFNPRLRSSLYAAANNLPMRNWAIANGYMVTDIFNGHHLFHAPTDAVRYQADSLAEVRSLLEEKYPWLKKGTALPRTTN